MAFVRSLAAVAVAAFALAAHAGPKTVCTITVNSSDEKETLAARLPRGEYTFVELVEKGRRDWLRSACRRRVSCDVLVISGHFNAGETFYSDRAGVEEHLEVDELERAACSDSCPGLFANLKEVYLFGCESLNPDASKYSSAYGESGRERMRRIFAGVPRIYGFSGAAPVGATAAAVLGRYFDRGGAGAFATGRPNGALLEAFRRNSMVQVAGTRPGEALHEERAQVCRFFDERDGPAAKLAVVHELMRGDMPRARTYFRRMEAMLAALTEGEKASPAFQAALARIAADESARTRFLALLGRAEPAESARMIELARALHWLSGDALREARASWATALLARPRPGYEEVELACRFDTGEGPGVRVDRLPSPLGEGPGVRVDIPVHAAIRACLGDAASRPAALALLGSADEREVQAAQAYLRHRPDVDVASLRAVVADIARGPGTASQARALEAIARLNVTDPEVLAGLARAYAQTRSVEVQRAIAEVFIRSGAAAKRPELVAVVREHRLKSGGGGGDLIDVLLASMAPAS